MFYYITNFTLIVVSWICSELEHFRREKEHNLSVFHFVHSTISLLIGASTDKSLSQESGFEHSFTSSNAQSISTATIIRSAEQLHRQYTTLEATLRLHLSQMDSLDKVDHYPDDSTVDKISHSNARTGYYM